MAVRVLFCSIAFPPKNDPESLQAGKYYKALAKNTDLNIQVLTSQNPTLFMPIDASLKGFGEKDIDLVELPIIENKYVNYALRKLGINLVDHPDSKYSFYRQWKSVAKTVEKPDVLYSRSFPLSSTLMAYHLKKAWGVPWFLHLSDPWSWSPLHHRSSRLQQWHEKHEGLCFEAADRISVSSPQIADKYRAIYPQFADKFCYYPNVLDKENVNPHSHQLSKKLRITYTGGLAGERTATPLLEALTILFEQQPELIDVLEVRFCGPIDRANQLVFDQCTLPFVAHLGEKSFQEAVQLQRESDVLVVIDNPVKQEDDAVFFPSKILDYLAAGKRILALTTPNSCSEELLKHHADVCYRNDIKGVQTVLRDAIVAFTQKNDAYFNLRMETEPYTAQFNAERLHKELLDLAQK